MIMKNVLKGLLFGLFSIIPGLSGGMLAIYFGDYKKIATIINKKEINSKSLMYLFTLLIGFIVGVYIFSNVMLLAYSNAYKFFSTLILIVNILLLIDMYYKSKCSIIYIFCSVICMIILYKCMLNSNFYISNNIILILTSSFLYSFGKVVPGVSSTSLLMVVHFYDKLLTFFINPVYSLFYKPLFWLLFWFSFVVSSLTILKIMSFFEKTSNLYKFLIPIQCLNVLLLI